MGVSLLISTTDSNSNKKNYMMREHVRPTSLLDCYLNEQVLAKKYVELGIFYSIILNITMLLLIDLSI